MIVSFIIAIAAWARGYLLRGTGFRRADFRVGVLLRVRRWAEAVAMVVAFYCAGIRGATATAVAVGWSGYVVWLLLSNLFSFRCRTYCRRRRGTHHPGWVNLPLSS